MIGAVLAISLLSVSEPDCVITLSKAQAAMPFGDHVASAWKGRPEPVKLDTPFARLFRTVLRQGAARGPNFAGHMTIVEWGCGSSCVEWAAVDAKTGKVFRLPDADYLETLHVGAGMSGVNFRSDSRLLVLAGSPRENSAREGLHIYLWRDGGFVALKHLPRAQVCEPYQGP
jgi:hypothetical protein